jgi:hypothetical protein
MSWVKKIISSEPVRSCRRKGYEGDEGQEPLKAQEALDYNIQKESSLHPVSWQAALRMGGPCPEHNIQMESRCILSCRRVVAEIVVLAFA